MSRAFANSSCVIPSCLRRNWGGHRSEGDVGRPYEFKDAETLLDDFFDEVERVPCLR